MLPDLVWEHAQTKVRAMKFRAVAAVAAIMVVVPAHITVAVAVAVLRTSTEFPIAPHKLVFKPAMVLHGCH